jgi:uncharacterized protein (TIGR01777 family)
MKTSSPQRILITGATGLVGQSLCAELNERGHIVRTLSRGERGDCQWNVLAGTLDPSVFDGVDVVVHLAGESIAQRWTDAARARILNSRVDSTRLLVDAILQQEIRPAFIAASGISYYGVDREALVDESSATGPGFLADVTRQWEGAAQHLTAAGVRTAFVRTGIVLSAQGGALAQMLPVFKLGLGGRIGTGQQQMSWISLQDLVAIYVLLVEDKSARGAFNAVAPQPVSNRVFTQALGHALARPTVLSVPTCAVKALLGEMGSETLLSNIGASPKRLTQMGFEWQQPDLLRALRDTLSSA